MLKKVAICLHGAIAKIGPRFSTQGSLYNNNSYVNYEACHLSILKHIVEPNKQYLFDFYIHGWNTDIQTNIISLYNPKKYLFEDNSIYNSEINTKINNPLYFGEASKSLSLKKSIELLKDNIYDLVIIYRPDLLLLKDIYLDNYDPDKIYSNGDPQGDFHFIMNYDNAIKLSFLYNSLEQGNICRQHFWIKNYIVNYLKQDLYQDNIIPGLHQEVLRKIYTTLIMTSKVNIEKLLEYGLSQQEILQYYDIYQ